MCLPYAEVAKALWPLFQLVLEEIKDRHLEWQDRTRDNPLATSKSWNYDLMRRTVLGAQGETDCSLPNQYQRGTDNNNALITHLVIFGCRFQDGITTELDAEAWVEGLIDGFGFDIPAVEHFIRLCQLNLPDGQTSPDMVTHMMHHIANPTVSTSQRSLYAHSIQCRRSISRQSSYVRESSSGSGRTGVASKKSMKFVRPDVDRPRSPLLSKTSTLDDRNSGNTSRK